MYKSLKSLGFVTPDHSAYQVRTGMMNAALFFFEQINWLELPERKTSGPWGQARFVQALASDSHVYQLTELSDGDPNLIETQENHIAVRSSSVSAQVAAETILEWASHVGAGEGASIEPANAAGSKWFVYLPALFKFGLEFV